MSTALAIELQRDGVQAFVKSWNALLAVHRRQERGPRADMSDFTPRCVRPLYTIGHSTRAASEFIEILRASAVTRVVDIRRIPWSHVNPQFDIAVLPVTLRRAGLDHSHLPSLGGLRGKGQRSDDSTNAGWERQPFRNYADYARTLPFREGLRELLELASRQTCVVMCAEAVWWRCHRRIVADYVLAHGSPVVHLLTRTTQMPASLTPFAVVDAGGGVTYPAPSISSVDGEEAHDSSPNALGLSWAPR